MIVKQYIKDFENLGLGMFVHFGLYSVHGMGEWHQFSNKVSPEKYDEAFARFDPVPDWAENIVLTAKDAGCKYITLTTRHHDGFSLYDTCGLNDYDAMHAKCHRDLVREFIDACNKHGIIPFFYHTLLDWHEESYKTDFKAYLKYLRQSVEIICKNYGKIGGIWFDGMWDKKGEDWEEDELYATIRKYQPNAMIINNTGLSAQGALGHIELDSVTFERGKPRAINTDAAPKYIASEMCEVLPKHWGYAADDFNYTSPANIIEELSFCRRYRSNFLLNVGPKGDGTLRNIDKAIFELIGEWMKYFGETIGAPAPCGIEVINKEKDFILKGDENTYYLFCHNLDVDASAHVGISQQAQYSDEFEFDKQIKSVNWLDNNELLSFEQNDGKTIVFTTKYCYGRNLVVRVAKITV